MTNPFYPTINITSAKYMKPQNDDGTIQSSEPNISIIAVIDGITKTVPLEVGNPEYDEIQRMVSEGILTIADAE